MVGRVTPCAPWSQKNWIKESCLVRRARSDAPYPPSDAHYPTLTHRDEGNSFSFLIAGNSLCPWIKNRFAIDQKPIMVMPMMQWHLEKPCPIRFRFIGCAVGFQLLKSPSKCTSLASGATQMKFTGLDIFLAE